MARVFIVERPRREIDVSSAEAYGDITFIFDRDDRRASIFDPDSYMHDVITQLNMKRFNPKEDYIAMTGGLLQVSQALLAVRAYTKEPIRVLHFNSSIELYEERMIAL